VRAASCYGIRQVWFSGDRVQLRGARGYRLPREERMRGYQDVELRQSDAFFDAFERDVVPVAVEVRAGSESLIEFDHPEKALYVFGAEDGSLGKAVVRHCHRFVIIPTRHCTNLAAAVYTTLYDRHAKRVRAGLEPAHRLAESRGSFSETDTMMDEVGVTWGR
jgi:tRNA(Leu) C34 or U34 (ribose-2'-O)-methylase TrmL